MLEQRDYLFRRIIEIDVYGVLILSRSELSDDRGLAYAAGTLDEKRVSAGPPSLPFEHFSVDFPPEWWREIFIRVLAIVSANLNCRFYPVSANLESRFYPVSANLEST